MVAIARVHASTMRRVSRTVTPAAAAARTTTSTQCSTLVVDDNDEPRVVCV